MSSYAVAAFTKLLTDFSCFPSFKRRVCISAMNVNSSSESWASGCGAGFEIFVGDRRMAVFLLVVPVLEIAEDCQRSKFHWTSTYWSLAFTPEDPSTLVTSDVSAGNGVRRGCGWSFSSQGIIGSFPGRKSSRCCWCSEPRSSRPQGISAPRCAMSSKAVATSPSVLGVPAGSVWSVCSVLKTRFASVDSPSYIFV